MNKIWVWFFAALIFVALTEMPSQTQPTVTDLNDPIIERGRKLYMEHCASCHGETGAGDGPLAASLETPLENLQAHVIHHDQATLFQMISQGVGDEMPGFASEFDMDQILDLIEYSYTLDASYQQFVQTEDAPEAVDIAQETKTPMDMGNMANMQMGDDVACPAHRPMNMGEGMVMSTDIMDAVGLGADLDGDNDPDEIVICLQILELSQNPANGLQRIAPGITLPVWVFAPDLGGMEPLARFPSPTIRVEQGDRVKIIVKNTHYFPHTLHLHGVIKPNEMDGVPDVTQPAIEPGDSFTYEFVAQNPGTHWYHCHVQTPLHLMMGLYGMFIIEENRPQNFITPLVMRSEMPDLSVANQESEFASEYVLLYQDIDPALHEPLNDPALTPAQLEKMIHRDYNTTERVPRYFVVNGRSFPDTLIDTQIEVAPDQHTLLRVLNAGIKPISLHIHGHKAEAIAIDGTPIPKAQRVARDTFTITSAQRVDLDLNTTMDGVHASGPGVWLIHDHSGDAVTTNGINPGGNIAYIVYDEYIDVYGLPKVAGDLSKFFNPNYYSGNEPVFEGAAFQDQSIINDGEPGVLRVFDLLPLWAWITIAVIIGMLIGILLIQLTMNLMRKTNDGGKA